MFDDHDTETAALIDLTDDLHNDAIDHAKQIAMPRTGDGCTRVVAGFIVAGFWLWVLVQVVT